MNETYDKKKLLAELLSEGVIDKEEYDKRISEIDSTAEKCVELAEAARKDGIYSEAVAKSSSDNIETIELAIKTFEQIEDWKDSAEQINSCRNKIAEINRAAEEKRRAAAERAKKTKRLVVALTSAAALVVIIVLLVTQVVIPNSNYNKAVKLYEEGKYEESIAAFEAMDGYKDSNEKISEVKKARSKESLKNPNVGDIVYFGEYQWRILEKKQNKVLLITEECISEKAYNDENEATTWANCTLRKWLNSEFYNDAFSDDEQGKIATTNIKNKDNPEYGTNGGSNTKDKIFLLSRDEAKKYFKNDEDRIAKYNGATDWWWLRSPGSGSDYAADVDCDGDIDEGGGNVYDTHGVRPALWLNLEP